MKFLFLFSIVFIQNALLPQTATEVASQQGSETVRPTINSIQTEGNNRINGSLAYAKGDDWLPWNNVRIELHRENEYFKPRLDALLEAGYTPTNALDTLLREDNVWQVGISSITRPAEIKHSKYGLSYSWFGFVGLGTGYYRVFVPGYPHLNRWAHFTANGKNIWIELEYIPQ